MKQHFRLALLALACVLHAGAAIPVTAQETEALGDDYVAGDFGRLLFQENGVTIRRASVETDPSLERVSGLNAPIFPGDGVITAFDQRAEIQLAGGSLVRIDRATDLTFLALPDPYAEVADNTVLQVEQGVIRINALLTSDSEFRIDTPAATAFLTDDADVRVTVEDDGATRVASLRGVVEVTANNASVLLRSGTKTMIYPGETPEAAVSFNTLRADGFDRWVAKRDAEWRENERYADNSEAYDEIPDEVRPYYRELSSHGRWVYADDYGWVWYPDRVANDWRPYYDGYWSYGTRGYFWVSHEPWGWAPYHYGRWGYIGSSWGWIPGRVFGGAWVAWSWGSAYVGWSPLGYWNTAYCGSPFAYNYGYYGPSWSFVNYSNFHYRSYRRHVVDWRHFDGDYLTDTAVVTRPPRVSPRDLARSATTRERAVRETRADRVAHLRPVDREVRSSQNNLRGVERRLKAERGSRAAAVRGRSGSAVDSRTRKGIYPDRNPATRTGRSDASELARRETTRGGIVRRGDSANTGRKATTSRSAARPSQGTRGSSSATKERTATPQRRMRDVYESMSGPRSTRERRAEPSASSSSGRTPRKATSPRATPPSRRPEASSPRRGSSRPQATPPSRSSSRPKASSPSRPKASPPSRSSSRPKASSPSRSSSRPRASTPKRSSGSRGSSSSKSKSGGKKGRRE